MKIVPLVAVDETVLTFSNVVEAAAAYAGGTTYLIGDHVTVSNGVRLDVYTSLANGNIGHTPASSPAWWNLVSVTYPQYDGAHTYAQGDIVVSATTHHAYEAVVGSNVGQPLTDPAKWLDLGPNNRWRMFDVSNTTQSVRQDAIVVELTCADLVDTVAVFNSSAAELQVTMTDPTDGLVFDQTFLLVADDGIDNWFDYFYMPIDQVPDKVVSGLPYYAGAVITVRLTNPGQEVRCGALAVGLARDIGGTQWGANVGIQDYSRKETDEFGDASFVKRAYAKRASLNVLVAAGAVDTVVNLLAAYRATPALYLGDEGYGALAILGIYKDFNVEIALPDLSYCSLNLEGLT